MAPSFEAVATARHEADRWQVRSIRNRNVEISTDLCSQPMRRFTTPSRLRRSVVTCNAADWENRCYSYLRLKTDKMLKRIQRSQTSTLDDLADVAQLRSDCSTTTAFVTKLNETLNEIKSCKCKICRNCCWPGIAKRGMCYEVVIDRVRCFCSENEIVTAGRRLYCWEDFAGRTGQSMRLLRCIWYIFIVNIFLINIVVFSQ